VHPLRHIPRYDDGAGGSRGPQGRAVPSVEDEGPAFARKGASEHETESP
jgi:hypothetical protein